ncbi:hypothetical protein LOK46_27535 [Methylobacterium sp. NMS14P]|uniref:hypothetical protein n=1 Tax=Methylobacterium sp. NMS14P TaxID=2894310 RepID=UPI002359B050|nr:hypothetical protein [Methylobacterium sp. NMS14P]WCS24835.1 hypothetical protein LOK46_27535 [Methylobacterium sp. NMS14P]
MPDNEDTIAFSIIARMKEISEVRYVRSDDNLTDVERDHAAEMDYRASVERENRLSGKAVKDPIWPEAAPEHWVCAWGMSPSSDVYYDLLETLEAHGAKDRPRLPGVTLANVERRERFVNTALANRLEAVKAQKTERGRTR